MSERTPKLLILGGVVVAVVGFLLLDGDYLPGRPNIIQIIGGRTILNGLPYRYILFFSVLLIVIGIYRQWESQG
jgi:hypothetical protein